MKDNTKKTENGQSELLSRCLVIIKRQKLIKNLATSWNIFISYLDLVN